MSLPAGMGSLATEVATPVMVSGACYLVAYWSQNCLAMLSENWLVWNVRGLKSRARHNVVREIISQENISLLSLQETKLDDCPPNPGDMWR